MNRNYIYFLEKLKRRLVGRKTNLTLTCGNATGQRRLICVLICNWCVPVYGNTRYNLFRLENLEEISKPGTRSAILQSCQLSTTTTTIKTAQTAAQLYTTRAISQSTSSVPIFIVGKRRCYASCTNI